MKGKKSWLILWSPKGLLPLRKRAAFWGHQHNSPLSPSEGPFHTAKQRYKIESCFLPIFSFSRVTYEGGMIRWYEQGAQKYLNPALAHSTLLIHAQGTMRSGHKDLLGCYRACVPGSTTEHSVVYWTGPQKTAQVQKLLRWDPYLGTSPPSVQLHTTEEQEVNRNAQAKRKS